MRKVTLFLLLGIVLFISGCSDDTENETAEADTNKKEQTESNKGKEAEQKDNSNEEEKKEGKLTTIGQTAEDELGNIELTKIKSINETLEHGPLKIELIDAKILKRSNITSELRNHINQFSSVDGDEFSYIQLRYNVENTTDKDVIWGNVANIVSDQKEQINGNMKEFMMIDNYTEILGEVKKEYIQGFIIEKPDVNELRLIFDSVDEKDPSSFDYLAEELNYNLTFE
ncbi:hypothetical protein CAI16_19915 [Virgibacillus dokdonensis]|uniref:DUF4352 domain-containing protein n=1 Tax=Virgibacillus dokdonensis TaxID=302167 RepID=A0A3E0WIH5_9BACI|nr:hypothetical protein [Virgibacillus dokdonensis]RFA31766.1 hypothetical protein CAI16_19915 [Virgibacillus dokdonensis]